MCGIYGSVGFAPDPARIDIVAHRGPDGRGWATFESSAGAVALGHRRLAVIGLGDTGRQPMCDPSGRFHLVFNGEIYNHIELRAELEAAGEAFRGDSDSEVLLRALVVWGWEAALVRLRGMFAFLLWDAAERRLIAARDRYGIKPLYWAEGAAGALAFGSEVKQLLGLPGVDARMNLARVHDFLAWGIADHTAETMFAGVRQLRGGECAIVVVSGDRPSMTVRRWYGLRAVDDRSSETEAAAADRVRTMLEDSVRLHLRSDVPVGSCLSGGIDSSSIVGLVARMLGTGHRLHAVSACFDEARVDERRYMRAVVARTGAVPHEVFPRAEDLLRHAGRITWHQDEPFGSSSIFAQWCVFDAAGRAGIKVMLDGQGADEQFGGYEQGFAWHAAELVRRGRWSDVARIMYARAAHGAPLAGQAMRLAAALLPSAIAVPLRRRRTVLHGSLRTDAFRAEAGALAPQDLAVRTLGLPQVCDVGTWCLAMTHASNLPMLLHWEDRNSMAHGVEARVPFLDHPLVEYTLALGSRHKFAGTETKRILRRAMAEILPPEVRDRRDKLGFSTPEAEWVRGPLRDAVRGGVEVTLRRWPGLLDAAAARRMAVTMLDGRRPFDSGLWRIVNLGIWGEQFRVAVS